MEGLVGVFLGALVAACFWAAICVVVTYAMKVPD